MRDSHSLRAETIASILKSRVELDALRCEVNEIMARSRETIAQTVELIGRANKLAERR